MKRLVLASMFLALAAPTAWAAGNINAGEAKAGACIMCHGTKGFPGIFYTLQLAGCNADKMVIKMNKYHTGKILHPIMNLMALPLTQQDEEDIAAFYQSLGKPVVVSPLIPNTCDSSEEQIPGMTQ